MTQSGRRISTILSSLESYGEQMGGEIKGGYNISFTQGATLDSALIDVGTSTFEYGQAYVALSRVKNLESLYIWDVEPTAFRAHPKVLAFYNHLHGKT
jgi:ATP-dependent DNA helicase PIF1